MKLILLLQLLMWSTASIGRYSWLAFQKSPLTPWLLQWPVHGLWASANAKNGYVKDDFNYCLSVTKSLDSDLCFIVKVIIFCFKPCPAGREGSIHRAGVFPQFLPQRERWGFALLWMSLFSPRFRFPLCFISYYNCMHLYSCWISLLKKRAVPSEHAIAYGVWLLLL